MTQDELLEREQELRDTIQAFWLKDILSDDPVRSNNGQLNKDQELKWLTEIVELASNYIGLCK